MTAMSAILSIATSEMRKSADVLLVMRGSYSYTAAAHSAPSGSKQDRRRQKSNRSGLCGNAPNFGQAGVIAQLGERFNGIEEVGGSIPPGSTSKIKQLYRFKRLIEA